MKGHETLNLCRDFTARSCRKVAGTGCLFRIRLAEGPSQKKVCAPCAKTMTRLQRKSQDRCPMVKHGRPYPESGFSKHIPLRCTITLDVKSSLSSCSEF